MRINHIPGRTRFIDKAQFYSGLLEPADRLVQRGQGAAHFTVASDFPAFDRNGDFDTWTRSLPLTRSRQTRPSPAANSFWRFPSASNPYGRPFRGNALFLFMGVWFLSLVIHGSVHAAPLTWWLGTAPRACMKTTSGAVVEQKAVWRDATKENIPCGSLTEEQRSQTAFCSTTLRAAGLLAVGGVGSVVTARFGDAPPSPPCPQPKSFAAAPLVVFKQALPAQPTFIGNQTPSSTQDPSHKV